MVDENVVVNNTVEENNTQPEVQPQVAAPADNITPAMAKMLEEIQALKSGQEIISKKADKLDKIKSAIDGEDDGASDEKFFTELTTKPKQTIEDLIKKKTDEIINPIISERVKEKLVYSDQQKFAELSAKDPEFNEIWSNVNQYVNPEEMAEVENSTNRVDIIYSLAKRRKDLAKVDKQKNSIQADRTAKNEINKTAVSERPINSGGTVSSETEQDTRLKDLTNARENFDSDGALKIATDILFENTQWGKKFKR